MILLCGIPTESPLAMVQDALQDLGAPLVVFNQRQTAAARLDFTVQAGRVTGEFILDGESWQLESFDGIYTRLMEDSLLPEICSEAGDSPARAHSRQLHEALMRWCEVTPARVVNRAGMMGSNCSKPYQGQFVSLHGFLVPETLVTNDPGLVREFRAEHGKIIFKSLSGVRSIVRQLEDADLERLEDIRWCPVQFQELVSGTDVRVHTVGSEVFATAVRSSAVDYRYGIRDGLPASLKAIELDADLARRCVALSKSLGLAFAGIDLRVTPDGRVYCFEVNPSPAFSYYEAHTGQPIARAVARYLCGKALDGSPVSGASVSQPDGARA